MNIRQINLPVSLVRINAGPCEIVGTMGILKTLTIQHALQMATEKLQERESPRREAEILLGHLLQQAREYLYTHQEVELSADQLDQYHEIVRRRQQGEPIAYITGKREFWDLELWVTPAVLVPRPETELLVETALELFTGDSLRNVADLGTGSGAIAIAVAKSRPQWRVTAVDTSNQALAVAKVNAEKHHTENISFQQYSWCDGLEPNSMDLVIANPPYVAPADPHLQTGDLRYEPLVALKADESGYADLFAIASSARACLKPGGWLLLEHGFEQHQRLSEKLQSLGYTSVTGRQDLAGHWRMMQAQWSSAAA